MAQEPYQINIGTRGPRNTFKEGIPAEEHYGVNRFQTGVKPTQGVPAEQGRGEFGVPMPGADYERGRPEPQTPHCTAITKKGEPCKAAPVRDEHLCIGHKRGQGRNT